MEDCDSTSDSKEIDENKTAVMCFLKALLQFLYTMGRNFPCKICLFLDLIRYTSNKILTK